MNVAQLMKKDPTCIRETATTREAAQMMQDVACGILPVIGSDGGERPVGVVDRPRYCDPLRGRRP